MIIGTPIPQSARTIIGAFQPKTKPPKPKPDFSGSPAANAAMASAERFGGE